MGNSSVILRFLLSYSSLGSHPSYKVIFTRRVLPVMCGDAPTVVICITWRSREDPVLQALPPNLPPAKVYSDDQSSYASNEICINWQAMLVFLLAGALE